MLMSEERRKKEEAWVNAQIDSMSENEKLGQLFMVGAYPPKGAGDEKKIFNDIDSHKIGGVIFFRGHEDKIASLTNKFQARSRFPMMMAMDAEWGTNMRVSASVKFPRQLMMGAIQNNALIYEFGVAVAKECKAMGIHINFAPVVDVNNKPANPVIGDRSFGENRKNVTAKSFQYIQGLQDCYLHPQQVRN
jgi:beta-glucosidase-like glycosyl hydrolase